MIVTLNATRRVPAGRSANAVESAGAETPTALRGRSMDQYTLDKFSGSGSDGECPTCGETFESKHGLRVHHGTVHGEKLPSDGVVCPVCDETFYPKPSHDRVTCSRACADTKKSEELRGERSPTWGGGPVEVPCRVCGETFETPRHKAHERRTCGHECKGAWMSRNYSGANSHEWRGGLDFYLSIRGALSPEPWRRTARRIRERDDHECRMCGGTNGPVALNVHHIVPVLGGGTNDDDLLISLCDACHSTVERYTARFAPGVIPTESGGESE